MEAEKHGTKLVLANGYVNKEKRWFDERIIAKGKGTRYVWLTEQGVKIEVPGETGRTKMTGHPELQRLAAEDILRLGGPGNGVQRVIYYGYRSGSKAEKARLAAKTRPEHEFDSALLFGEGYGKAEAEHFRPAYCVLALGGTGHCPPKAKRNRHPRVAKHRPAVSS